MVLSPVLSILSDLTDAEEDVVFLFFLLLTLVVDWVVPFCSRNFRNESSCILR